MAAVHSTTIPCEPYTALSRTMKAAFLHYLSLPAEVRFPPSDIIRELKQRRRRRRRGGRLVKKNEFTFYLRNSRLSRSVRYAKGSENVLKLNTQRRRSASNGNMKN